MKNMERELLILLPEEFYDEVALQQEAGFLHRVLTQVDTLEHTAEAVEYLNLHRGGITQNKLRIENALRRPVLGHFQFIIHKN